MLDILIVGVLCYQLHRMARERGISARPFILHYLAGFFIMVSVMIYIFFSVYGVQGYKDQKALDEMLKFEPFAILFEVGLFIYMRKRIQKTPIRHDDDNDLTPPAPLNKDKKDLSYFR